MHQTISCTRAALTSVIGGPLSDFHSLIKSNIWYLHSESARVKGFGCRRGTERWPQYKGPSSESLRRRNPREGGDCLAGYGDLTPERV